jgi:hypothetical protein
MTDQQDGKRATDANCLGYCRCPQCGGDAAWSYTYHRHQCKDRACAHRFIEHDDTQFTEDRTDD